MIPTRFWLIRHATVVPAALEFLYGQMDVPICDERLARDGPCYRALAQRLPDPAIWLVTPLSRTRRTAEAIMQAGYGVVAAETEASLLEQDFGTWQGMRMSDCIRRGSGHPFWPIGGDERPPGGESFTDPRARVGAGLDALHAAHPRRDIVAVSHGGAIRAAVAHALDLTGDQALCLAVENLSLTRIERHEPGWRVVTLNEQVSI